jgi:hypothetical protein
VAVPGDGGWATCAVPFDNSERAPDRPVAGLLPLGAILRLFKADRGEPVRLESQESVWRTASLLTSVMLPGLFVDLEEAVLRNTDRFASEGLYGHLHFHRDRRFVDQVQAFMSGRI